MSAEQSKAESMQRALEEQKKALGQQMTMEREELEKAKVSAALPSGSARHVHHKGHAPSVATPTTNGHALYHMGTPTTKGHAQEHGPVSTATNHVRSTALPTRPFPVQTALLQEQKSVMHKCGEERRRLAAEWSEFFAQQKLSKERAEREAERALQVDSQREGTLVSLAKVGPTALCPGLGAVGRDGVCPAEAKDSSLVRVTPFPTSRAFREPCGTGD